MLNYSIGNHKLGRDTLIFNMGPASTCPSRKLGLCQIPENRCYALKSEFLYPQVLPYRKRQARYWKRNGPERIARDIRQALKRHKKIKYIRVNEAGDFYSQADIEKLVKISAFVPGVTFYCYTARRDLKFDIIRPDNLIISGSGFMVDNNFCLNADGAKYNCPGNCRACNLCKTNSHKLINIRLH